MTQADRYHGGLVFAGAQKNVLERFGQIVSATLKDYGHHVERQSMMSEHRARVTANQYLVTLNLGADANPSGHSAPTNISAMNPEVSAKNHCQADLFQRLEINLCPVDSTRSDQTHSELLLVVMMYRMVEECSADYVEWLDPNTVLSSTEFLGTFTSVSPRRVRRRQQILDDRVSDGLPFASIEETAQGLDMQYDAIEAQKSFDAHVRPISISEQKALSLAFRLEEFTDEFDTEYYEGEPENNVRRMASWGMTGMLFFVSAPIAVSMAAVNLIKGEDFRLNTQVLSLSGFLVAMESTGAIAEVVSYLPV